MSEDLDDKIRQIREEVIMSTLTTSLVAGAVLLAGHMARNLHIGNTLGFIYPLLYGLLVAVYLLRWRIGANRIAWLAPLLLYTAATAGLFVYGLAGNSTAVYMGFCFISTVFFGARGGAIAILLSIASFALAGFFILDGRLVLQFDMAAFMLDPYTWLAAAVTLGSIAWLLLQQVSRLNQHLYRLLREQHHHARHDTLTGLANRPALESILEQSIALAARSGDMVGVILLDLDRFKTINDSLGHNVGDRLLVEVAARIRQCIRNADVAARLGGDEFVVVIPRLDSPDVTTVAGRLVETLSQPYRLDGRELRAPPSLGISVCPQDASDVETLIRYADTAMYSAKERGGGCFRYFSPEMNVIATRRLHVETGLRDSLAAGHIEVHYQPKIDFSGQITGLEALARWSINNEVVADPAQFIAVAEESTLINEFGEWMLGAVCRQIREWLDSGIDAPRVAINLSARQLRLADLPDTVAKAIADAGIPAHLLEFEVTETAAMESLDDAERVLGELARMGLTISLDDFGTGYSSLANLRSLPLDALKLDYSFVRDITIDANDLAIARGTIALAHSLGLRVIAEGVEATAQWAMLGELGCDEMQGFLIARPAPATALATFIEEGFIPVPLHDAAPAAPEDPSELQP